MVVVDVVGETEVDSVEVAEAEILAFAVVEVGVVAVVVVAVGILEEGAVGILEEVVGISEEVVEIIEEAAEISEVEEVEASTVVVVEVEVALGNKGGAWPFLSIFPSNLIWNAVYSQRTSRRPWTFGLRISPKMSL